MKQRASREAVPGPYRALGITPEDMQFMRDEYQRRAQDPEVSALCQAFGNLEFLCNPTALANFTLPEAVS